MEKGLSLYNITNRFIELFEKAEDGELTQEEFNEQGNELALALQNKGVSIVGYARNMESLIEAMKTEEKRIAENRKALENRYDRFKEYVKVNMMKLGLEKLENEIGTLAVRKNPVSVEVYDEALISDKYKKKKVTVTIDKTAINGKCSKCGKCCGLFIPVTKKEVSTIKKYVKENKIEPENRYNGKDLELRCPFLDLKNHKCKIYTVRPFVCRDFMCSRKDWKRFRDKYQERADYNGFKDNKWIKKGMYSMDELVYGDITMHIRMLIEYAKNEKGNVTKENFIKALRVIERIDLLEKIELKGEDEND